MKIDRPDKLRITWTKTPTRKNDAWGTPVNYIRMLAHRLFRLRRYQNQGRRYG
jgi:hypothetical protein